MTYLKDACEKAPHARFGRAGQAVEVWSDLGAWSAEAVRGYRGGYLPEERRGIERALREGLVRAVVSTNALELGIDIGSLDVSLLAGYPGTIASTWQRAGRAGRRSGTSAAVLIASSAPLDQFIVQNPDYFFGHSPEHGYIQPDNPEIVVNHLKCAAFELPLRLEETFGRLDLPELCRLLEENGLLHRSGDAYHWSSDAYPADAISLRAVTSDNFVIVDESRDLEDAPRVIGEVDFSSALTTVHEKAIYLHEGRQFHVERFGYQQRKAYVKAVEGNYFTDAISHTQVEILEELARAEVAPRGEGTGAARAHGEVQVNTQVVGFKKLKFYTLENVGAGQLSMPEQQMHTSAYWLSLSREFLEALPYPPAARQNGVVALGNALRTMATLLVMCDRRDLGVAVGTPGRPNTLPTFTSTTTIPADRLERTAVRAAPPTARADPANDRALRLRRRCSFLCGPVGEVGEHGKEVALAILAALKSGGETNDRCINAVWVFRYHIPNVGSLAAARDDNVEDDKFWFNLGAVFMQSSVTEPRRSGNGHWRGTEMQTELDRLRRKIARIDRKWRYGPPAAAAEEQSRWSALSAALSPQGVENVLDGEILETPSGSCFCSSHTYGFHRRHGNADISALAEMDGAPLGVTAPPSRWAFLDTETTGLAGGTGTYCFLAGC